MFDPWMRHGNDISHGMASNLEGCNGLFDGSCASFSASTECLGTQPNRDDGSHPLLKVQAV